MITVLGGGLAGCAAAIAARKEGAAVEVIEKSTFPRHKVCGEFLTAEARPLLDSLGVQLPEAAAIRSVRLRFKWTEKTFNLPEAALGISRYLLDDRLQAQARSLGAAFVREPPRPVDIVASGRQPRSVRGRRFFGFKNHFRGPANDAVELYFFRGGYVGVNPVEGGVTNVCGVLPEELLRSMSFRIDDVVNQFQPLRERLDGLEPVMEWLKTGPLIYESKIGSTDAFACGDALLFTDPFTGSGMFAALATGACAGQTKARDQPLEVFRTQSGRILSRAFSAAGFLRSLLKTPVAGLMMPFVPGPVLYRLTRPRA